jgi:hypothetical protein
MPDVESATLASTCSRGVGANWHGAAFVGGRSRRALGGTYHLVELLPDAAESLRHLAELGTHLLFRGLFFHGLCFCLPT